MPTTRDWGPIALLLVFAALAMAGTMDAQDVENGRHQYCEMVAQWDKGATQGITPEQRHGWPPFDGRKQCEKGAES